MFCCHTTPTIAAPYLSSSYYKHQQRCHFTHYRDRQKTIAACYSEGLLTLTLNLTLTNHRATNHNPKPISHPNFRTFRIVGQYPKNSRRYFQWCYFYLTDIIFQVFSRLGFIVKTYTRKMLPHSGHHTFAGNTVGPRIIGADQREGNVNGGKHTAAIAALTRMPW